MEKDKLTRQRSRSGGDRRRNRTSILNLRLVPQLEPRAGGLDAAFKDQVELLERRSDGVLGPKLLEKIGGREGLGADEESIGEVREEEALGVRHDERDNRE